MNVESKIKEAIEKITKDPAILAKFQANPEKTVEDILGVDLPDGLVDKVVAGVKGKISLDSVSGAVNKLKGLF